MTTALTTLQRVKDRLTITTGHDELLQRLIDAASDYVLRTTGIIADTTVQDVQELISLKHGQCIVHLTRRPLVQFLSLEERRGSFTNPQWTTVDQDNYRVEGFEFPTIYLETSFPHGRHVLRANYQAGYVVDFTNPSNHTLPNEITDVVERMVVRLFRYRHSEGKAAEASEGGSVQWNVNPTQEELNVLNRYISIRL